MIDTPQMANGALNRIELPELIARVNDSDVATLRHNVVKILDLVQNQDTSAHDLSENIETDPPLCSRILRVANSAFYGSHRHIGAIREAIIWLGFNTVKELALSQTMSEFFERNGVMADFSLRNLWKHCLLSAVGSKLLYRREFALGGEAAYTAGLLHEIGLIVEAQFCQEQFAAVVTRVSDGNLRPFENDVLGFDHCECGAALAQDWGFPEHLVDCIRYHHSPLDAPEPSRRLVLAVFLADQMAHTVLPVFNDEPEFDKNLVTACFEELNMEREAFELLVKELGQEAQKLIEKGLMS